MTAFPHSSQLSVEEYLRLDNEDNEARYEYIDGQMLMLAGGTPDHAKSAQILLVSFTVS